MSFHYAETIRNHRKEVGWTQTELAQKSNCSLATIQNIEANRANPEIQTLERILNSLGCELKVTPKSIQLDYWPSLGLPLMIEKARPVRPTPELLLEQGQMISARLESITEERLRTAFVSFFEAIRSHYPSVYSRMGDQIHQWAQKHSARDYRPKLRRIALERLSVYL